MAQVTVAWTVENRSVPPTLPVLDAWKVSVAIPGQPAAGETVLPDLAARTVDLDVPDGSGYVATVALVSQDGAAIGPAVSSPPFDLRTMPVPVAVTVTVPGGSVPEAPPVPPLPGRISPGVRSVP